MLEPGVGGAEVGAGVGAAALAALMSARPCMMTAA
jgi:hypothetical protein